MNVHIAFLGSSSFVIPIVDSIYTSQRKKLEDVFREQFLWLQQNQIQLLNILPSWWKERGAETILKGVPEEIRTSEIKLSLIISQPDAEHRGKVFANPAVQYSREHNLNLFLPAKINHEWDNYIETRNPDIDVFVVASYGQIISSRILEYARFGGVNWHPSNLPLYRGATPMQTALKDGVKETGLSWIQMVKAMDAGDILVQMSRQLHESTTFSELAEQMGELGSHTWSLALLANILEKSGQSELLPIAQDKSKVTFCSMLTKQDRIIDPNQVTACEVYNMWRGYHLFPGVAFYDDEFKQEVVIVECEYPVNNELDQCQIQYEGGFWRQVRGGKTLHTLLVCKDKSLIKIHKIRLQNGKQIDFKGYQFQ